MNCKVQLLEHDTLGPSRVVIANNDSNVQSYVMQTGCE